MKYFAHRGASACAPANSVPAFKLAQAQGARCYELDVQLTQDGALVVHHDYQLSTDTTCPLSVAAATRADVQDCCFLPQFAYGIKNARPAFLEEIFPVVAVGLDILNIELKNDGNLYPGLVEKVLACVQTHGAEVSDKVLFSSFDYATLERLRVLAPQARIGWLTRAFDPVLARAIQVESIHINSARLTADMVQVCRRNNWRIYVYTVNDLAKAACLEKLGIDGIFTDCPFLFLKS